MFVTHFWTRTNTYRLVHVEQENFHFPGRTQRRLLLDMTPNFCTHFYETLLNKYPKLLNTKTKRNTVPPNFGKGIYRARFLQTFTVNRLKLAWTFQVSCGNMCSLRRCLATTWFQCLFDFWGKLWVCGLADRKEKCRKNRWGGGGSSIRRYLVGRSQQQHSYTGIPGRLKQRRLYRSCNSSSRCGREGRGQECREVGLQHVVTSIAIRRSAQQDGESLWTSIQWRARMNRF